MILEQQIESQVIAAVRDEDVDGVYYSGAWDEAVSGDVKGDEGVSAAVLAVTVSPRTMSDYGGGVDFVEADIPVSISCSVSADSDPTGTLVMRLYRKCARKVWAWVKCVTSEQDTDLTVYDGEDEVFTPGGVMQTAGTPPAYVSQARMWTWSLSFVIKGIIKE